MSFSHNHPSPAAVFAIVRIARHFGHGWTNFIAARHERGDESRDMVLFAEAVDYYGWHVAAHQVTARMQEAETRPYELGLRPSLTHTSGTGRYAWDVIPSLWGDDYLYLTVSRPGGAVVTARIALDHRAALFEGAAHVTVLPGAEERHEGYMAEMLHAAGIHEWVTDRTLPVAEERETRLPRKAQRDPIAVDLAAWG